MADVVAVLAAAWVAAGLTMLVLGRRFVGLAGLAAGVALAGVAAADARFPGPVLEAVGVWSAPLAAPLLAAALAGRRALAAVAVTGGVLAGPVFAAVSDPFLDPTCVLPCKARPLALTYDQGLIGAARGLGAVLVVASVFGLAWAVRHDRVRCGALALVGTCGAALALDVGPTDWLVAAAGAVALAPYGLDLHVLLQQRRALSDLQAALVIATFDLEGELRRKVHDPGLTIYHRVDETWADRQGVPERLATDDTVTEVLSAGDHPARVHHGIGSVDERMLRSILAGPGWLALDLGRLEATVAVHGRRRQESARRIVARADSERRSLERDVHDGAQQHLLSLGLELQLAAAQSDGVERRSRLDVQHTEIGVALDELREIAHGIYPSALVRGDLQHAVRSLVRSVAGDVRLVWQDEDSAGALPPETARTAYLVCAQTTADAAGPIAIEIAAGPDVLRVVMDGPVSPPHGTVVDRVAALRGRITQEALRTEVELPCASSSPRIS